MDKEKEADAEVLGFVDDDEQEELEPDDSPEATKEAAMSSGDVEITPVEVELEDDDEESA